MSLDTHKEGGLSLFHLFGVALDTLQPLLVCCGLFPFALLFTNNSVTEYFDLPLGILEKLKFSYNQKKKEITPPLHRCICVTYKPKDNYLGVKNFFKPLQNL